MQTCTSCMQGGPKTPPPPFQHLLLKPQKSCFASPFSQSPHQNMQHPSSPLLPSLHFTLKLSFKRILSPPSVYIFNCIIQVAVFYACPKPLPPFPLSPRIRPRAKVVKHSVIHQWRVSTQCSPLCFFMEEERRAPLSSLLACVMQFLPWEQRDNPIRGEVMTLLNRRGGKEPPICNRRFYTLL